MQLEDIVEQMVSMQADRVGRDMQWIELLSTLVHSQVSEKVMHGMVRPELLQVVESLMPSRVNGVSSSGEDDEERGGISGAVRSQSVDKISSRESR